MNYFCVDCEASGPVPPLFNLLSIGVTVVRPRDDRHVLGESFYVEPGKIHEGINKGNAPVKAIASFIVEKGKPLTSQVPK